MYLRPLAVNLRRAIKFVFNHERHESRESSKMEFRGLRVFRGQTCFARFLKKALASTLGLGLLQFVRGTPNEREFTA